MRLPIRVRITAAFAVVIAVLMLGLSVAIYWSISTALLDEIDSGLRFRAAALASDSNPGTIETAHPALQERGEAFDQLLSASSKVLRTTPGIPPTPLLTAEQLADLHGPTFFVRPVAGVVGPARLLAIRLTDSTGEQYLVVGATMTDRHDTLRQLSVVLAIGLPVGIGLACLAGWIVAGLALRPIERMRRQASAITASGLDRRLALPQVRDELYRLGRTLNDMLERLDRSRRRDRLFIARASHELRTPLATLKAELDLAQSAPRSNTDLTAAVASASEETDRLVRLANDLLAQARIEHGRLPVRREPTALRSLLDGSVLALSAQATRRSISVTVDALDHHVNIDPIRFRQALDNVLDNAIRHSPRGGPVRISATVTRRVLTVTVQDSGPGFADVVAEQTRIDRDSDDEPAQPLGLGLPIARTVAASHEGHLTLANSPTGGATVTLTFATIDSNLPETRPVHPRTQPVINTQVLDSQATTPSGESAY